MSTTIDYYELLECERTADDATIKSRYRKLAMQYHPDRNAGCKESEAKFKAISEAYDCLKDPQKRAAYDRYGHAAFQQGGMGGGGHGGQTSAPFSDIFESVFGEFMGGGRGGGRQQPRRGADLRYDMEITLEEAFHGKSTEITIDVSAACDTCDGTGAKPGTSAKTCQQCGGHGKVRAQQGFFVVERTCPVCQGAGQIIADPCPDCRGDGRVEKTKTLAVNIPAGVDEGTRIRLSGEGEAGARGAPAGDLYIFLHVKRHAIFERRARPCSHARRSASPRRRWVDRCRSPDSMAVRMRSRFRRVSSRASNSASAGPACPFCKGAAPATWSCRSRSRRRPSCRPASASCSNSSVKPRPATNAPKAVAFSPS